MSTLRSDSDLASSQCKRITRPFEHPSTYLNSSWNQSPSGVVIRFLSSLYFCCNDFFESFIRLDFTWDGSECCNDVTVADVGTFWEISNEKPHTSLTLLIWKPRNRSKLYRTERRYHFGCLFLIEREDRINRRTNNLMFLFVDSRSTTSRRQTLSKWSPSWMNQECVAERRAENCKPW